MHEEAADKFSLLGEYLHSVAAALADIDEPVIGDVDAVQRGCELLLIRRRPRFPVVRWRGVIVDLAQGDAVAAPAAFERATAHVIHEHAFLIHDVKLVGVFVQIEEENPAGKYIDVLVVLLYGLRFFTGRRSHSTMAELPEKFSVTRKFLDTVSPGAPPQPDVSFSIDEDRMFGAGARLFDSLGRPARHVTRSSPALQQVTIRVEFQYGRRGN